MKILDRDEKYWIETGNIGQRGGKFGQRGEIWDCEGTFWVEWENIGQKGKIFYSEGNFGQ